MTTANPRVAGYIPPSIHDRFKSFKEERGIKGDSQALAVLMAEFFNVPHSVIQGVDYSSFVTQEQFKELVSKVSEMSTALEKSSSLSGLLGSLPEKMMRLEKRVADLQKEPFSETKSLPSENEAIPGQIALPGIGSSNTLGDSLKQPEGEIEPDSLSKPLGKEWLSTKEAWEALNKPCPYDTFRKLSPEKLFDLYGVQADLEKKAGGKYNAKWLKLPSGDSLEES